MLAPRWQGGRSGALPSELGEPFACSQPAPLRRGLLTRWSRRNRSAGPWPLIAPEMRWGEALSRRRAQ